MPQCATHLPLNENGEILTAGTVYEQAIVVRVYGI